jgi:hypothetical protein
MYLKLCGSRWDMAAHNATQAKHLIIHDLDLRRQARQQLPFVLTL